MDRENTPTGCWIMSRRGCGRHLDRIRIDRTHIVASIDPVNPVYIHKVEQFYAVDGIAGGDSDQPRFALEDATSRDHEVLRRPTSLTRRHDFLKAAYGTPLVHGHS